MFFPALDVNCRWRASTWNGNAEDMSEHAVPGPVDQPLGVQDAKGQGLDVTTEIPAEIMELMSLYQQPLRGTRTVEYLRKRR